MSRTARIAAVAAAVLFVASASIDIPRDQPLVFTDPIDYILEAVFAGALWASAVALACMAVSNSRIPARLTIGTAALGHIAFATAATATLANGRESLDILASVGLVLIMAGYVGFFIADLIRMAEPRFSGIALFIATVGMISLGEGWGLIAWGAGWFAVAAMMRDRQPSLAPVGSAPAPRDPHRV